MVATTEVAAFCERIFDIAIVSKIPVAFVRVMFAPKILADIPELAEYYKPEIAQLRLIAKDPAVTAEFWIRSRHGTWRFFLVAPSTLAGIDREGKRIVSGQTVAYLAGVNLLLPVTSRFPVLDRSPYRARLYRFCLTPLFCRSNNSEKHGNPSGTIHGFQAGNGEVVIGNVTTAGRRAICVSGHFQDRSREKVPSLVNRTGDPRSFS